MGFILGFPRDGTSRCPFVPGQKTILVLVSLCPGTRAGANVPGQNPLSRDVPGQNELKIFKQNDQVFCFRTSFSCFRTSFSCFRTSFSCFRTSFSVLEHHFPILERPFLLCPVLSRVPYRILAVPARPVLNFGCPGPSRPLARFLACPVVPLSRDNEGTSVPLSRKVALSRPIGNPSSQLDGS